LSSRQGNRNSHLFKEERCVFTSKISRKSAKATALYISRKARKNIVGNKQKRNKINKKININQDI
jgi:hypothetical protein